MVGIQFYGEEGDEVILDDQVKSWFLSDQSPIIVYDIGLYRFLWLMPIVSESILLTQC